MIDTHSHLFDEAFNLDLKECIDRCYKENVNKVVLVGFSKETNMLAQKLSKEYNIFYPTAGIHPSEANSDWAEQIIYLEDFINSNKVYAIGECGLDYYWTKENMEYQKSLFKAQIEMSIKYDLPIIIHMRDASNDTYELLKEYEGKLKGVMHCYSGSLEMAYEFIKLGLHISLGGPVTFKNAKEPKNVAINIPLDKLLIETDCPYLAPTPYRGKRNESSYVKNVLIEIANLRNMDVLELENILEKNSIELFGLGVK